MSTETSSESNSSMGEFSSLMKIMAIACPECGRQADVNITAPLPRGYTMTCASCKARFRIDLYSYSQRSSMTASSASCASCGRPLTAFETCGSCGADFPSFYAASCDTKSARKSSGPPVKTVIALVLLAALVAALFVQRTARNQDAYIDNYLKLLNAVATGTELRLRPAAPAEPAAAPDNTSYRLGRISTEAKQLMQQLTQPPTEFSSAHHKLSQLYAVYQEAERLPVAPKGAPSQAADLKTRYLAGVQELKASLPPRLQKELEAARVKYSGLKTL